MMKMFVVVIAVVAMCLMVAEARPGRGDKGGGRGRRPRPRPLAGPAKFCKGLVNGNITNDNATFDDVFETVTVVCGELITFLEENKPEEATPEDERTKRRAGPGGPSRGPGGRRGPGGAGGEEGEEREGEREEPTPVEKLLRFCGGVEKFQPREEAPEGLTDILAKFTAPCAEANTLAGNDNDEEEEEEA